MSKDTVQINQERFSKGEIKLIQDADKLAAEAHQGQLRKSGEPYITHPRAVAATLADWGMEAETVAAGLLHDVVEDTQVTLDELGAQFGLTIATLVDGVTKLSKVAYKPNITGSTMRQAISAENLRKLLLAMTGDLRVVIIKLADRLHNLQTLNSLTPEQQQRIAWQSLEIYAPLADRLGMGALKAEIEDLSFRYTDPQAYKRIEVMMNAYLKRTSQYLAMLKRFISDELRGAGISVISIEGRQKHLYSVYKKLAKTEGDFDKIYDLRAVRIIVPSVTDCYQVMGVLHQHFKPLITRIKDYIAVPKPNGYRSLHTTVFALDGRITEIQIRTPEMHDEAERGLAAHFYYDAQKSTKAYAKGQADKVPDKLGWVNNLTEVSTSLASSNEFIEALKVDLFRDRIFVFSPKGDLYDLPEGSTAIDFAFAVHSDIGLRVQGAKANGRILALHDPLHNGDVVEILTRKLPQPHRDWLELVRTPSARNRIRAWFRAGDRAANIESGGVSLGQELRAWEIMRIQELPAGRLLAVAADMNYRDEQSLLAAIGEGTVQPAAVSRRLFPAEEARPAKSRRKPVATGKVVVAGARGLPYHFAPCCHPRYPHPIVGYVTRGSGVTLHLPDCLNLPPEPDRLVEAGWEVAGQQDRLVVALEIVGLNRVGLLSDITSLLSKRNINISNIQSTHSASGEESRISFNVEVGELHTVAELIKKLELLPGVSAVRRKRT